MMHKDGVAGSYRIVPDHICSLEELGFLPNSVATIERMLDYNNGLVLVTGPIGGGKTTTLGAMIDILNTKREDHIITVEDPIEILQVSKNCQVNQRQIGTHTKSYHSALKAALREDPDVIIIGEMHDLETIENAITASETGHLVIGTLHTNSVSQTVDRVIDSFAEAQQNQVRQQFASSLLAVVAQRLLRTIDGAGRVGAFEVMIATPAIQALIRENKTYQLQSIIETAYKDGMITMDKALEDLYTSGQLSYDDLKAFKPDVQETAAF